MGIGINPWDALVILAFVVGTLAVGIHSSRTVKKQSDFYLGGRKLGRGLQFFLQFGNSTDAASGPTLAAGVYNNGAGGSFLNGFQAVFLTPFFWFTQPWYRRVRVTTVADIFVDRFGDKGLASAYAIYNIFIILFVLGLGNVAGYKVAAAMLPKQEKEWTDQDRQNIGEYHEYQALKKQVASGTLPVTDKRYAALDSRVQRGEISSFVSFVRPVPFYIAYNAIIAVYIVMGGLRAAAITDAIQGLLILAMSILLIPVGLHYVHGFAGMHQEAGDPKKFTFAGSLSILSIFAISVGSLIQLFGLSHNMSTGGSAKDENTARFGMLTGSFTKRFVIIAWILCGLLAVAIFNNHSLSDGDDAWGALSQKLLGPGLLGLMLAGLLLGNMPSVGVNAISLSGLAARNIYMPLFPGRSEKHYLRAGQLCIVIFLTLGILFALVFSDLTILYTYRVRYGIFFGAPMFLIYFWRRLTARSISVAFYLWVVLIVAIPTAVPYITSIRRMPGLILQTDQYTDEKGAIVAPTPLFFDKLPLIDATDQSKGREGFGRFKIEVYTLYLLGIPVKTFNESSITATEWLFDSVFPFVILMLVSYMTQPDDPARSDRFYAKMRTPVAPTPEEDRQQIELSNADPHRFDDKKLFTSSQWQFAKWTKADYIGFFGCWGIVVLILLLYYGMLRLGA